MSNRRIFYSALLSAMPLLSLLIAGCGGPAVFLDRTYDFDYLERVAIVPFENLAQSQPAGRQATLIFITELLATESFTVIEPGETAKVLTEINPTRTTALSLEQIQEMGKRLNAQGLIFGTVNESSTIRSGGVTVPTVTLDLRLVETETGSTIWAATHTQGHPNLLTSLFGIGAQSTSETMRDCVHHVIKTLVK